MIHPWQKYILHPLTALLLAIGSALFFKRYEFVAFPYSWFVTAVLVFVGYLLLSKKYDPILSLIFFGVAVFVMLKAAQLTGPVPQKPLDLQDYQEKLLVLATFVGEKRTNDDAWPKNTPGAEKALSALVGLPVRFCADSNCDWLPAQALKGVTKSWFVGLILTEQNKLGLIDQELQMKFLDVPKR
ncbi:MAG: hypothetical protein H7A33_02430 [Deltaproteobacteria bacterium]|nr:hypothetical protein [Deltaproteobacteria bacterium]